MSADSAIIGFIHWSYPLVLRKATDLLINHILTLVVVINTDQLIQHSEKLVTAQEKSPRTRFRGFGKVLNE